MMNERERELFEELFGKKPENEKPPTKTDGFESLVTEEEFGAILLLKKALDNYLDIHNRINVERMEKKESMIEKGEYANIQYLMLGDCAKDAMKNINLMVGIHTLNKEAIDKMAKHEEMSIENLLHKMMVDMLMKDILG